MLGPFETQLSSRRKWLFRLIACGVPALVGACLVVWVLIFQERLTFDRNTGWPKLQSPPVYLEEPGHEITGHRYVYDPLLGWRNIPGWSATSRGRKLTINSKGLRDREYAYEPPEGVSRVLVLGDSYAWGYGVSDEEVFTEVLESRLQVGPARWEVINTGVSGWGTDQEFLFLKEEGFRYRPDVVVLAFFLMNDPFNNVNSAQYGLHKPVFKDTLLTRANTPVPLPESDQLPYTVEADPVELTCAILAAMQEECAQRDCPLVIMKFGRFLYPDHPDAAQFEAKFQTLLAQGNHPYYLDLDDAFDERAIAADRLLEGNDDGHWNAFGHRITAEILHAFLLEAKLLNSSRS